MQIKLKTAAKINLLLDLTAKLPGGYHSIYTIMQSVAVYDTVTAEETGDGKISFFCSDGELPMDCGNTAVKAAELFFQKTGIKNPGVRITLEKTIPKQAGMAGGSADAAGVLHALNRLLSSQLTRAQLCEIGVGVGADVPFCIRGGAMLCQDIGQVTAPLPSLTDCYIVCVKPECNISTKQAYSAFDELKNVRHPEKETALHAYVSGDLQTFFSVASNVFEQAIEVPGRVEIKAVMRSFGTEYAFMTGSGSVICGIFRNRETAFSCAEKLKDDYAQVFLTQPADRSVEFLS